MEHKIGEKQENITSTCNKLVINLKKRKMGKKSLKYTQSKASCLTNGVCGGLLALLVLAVVACDSSMGSLRLQCSPVRAHQH